MPAHSRRVARLVAIAVVASVLAFVLSQDWAGHASQQPSQPSNPPPGNQAHGEQDVQPGARRAVATAQEQAPTAEPKEYGTLIVQVRREHDAAPAAGVIVTARPVDGSQHVLSTRTLPTDVAGRAVFDRLVAGPHEVRLDRGLEKKPVIIAGKVTELSFQLPRGRRIQCAHRQRPHLDPPVREFEQARARQCSRPVGPRGALRAG